MASSLVLIRGCLLPESMACPSRTMINPKDEGQVTLLILINLGLLGGAKS